MSAPPYTINFGSGVGRLIKDLSKADSRRHKKVRKSLELLQVHGPGYPSLNSHKYSSLTGPNGEEVWESYVENHTPGAWRVWWIYGPAADSITIVAIGKHP